MSFIKDHINLIFRPKTECGQIKHNIVPFKIAQPLQLQSQIRKLNSMWWKKSGFSLIIWARPIWTITNYISAMQWIQWKLPNTTNFQMIFYYTVYSHTKYATIWQKDYHQWLSCGTHGNPKYNFLYVSNWKVNVGNQSG